MKGKKSCLGRRSCIRRQRWDDLVVSAEICEDVWSPIPPSIEAAREGAIILVNCSASDETIGKDSYREELIKGQSARLIAGYVYANAGDGESTTDVVFGGHNIIAENGTILKEAKRFANEMIVSEIDIFRLLSERRKKYNFPDNGRTLSSKSTVPHKCGRDSTYQKLCTDPFCSTEYGREGKAL